MDKFLHILQQLKELSLLVNEVAASKFIFCKDNYQLCAELRKGILVEGGTFGGHQ